jgi:hypothetical protein
MIEIADIQPNMDVQTAEYTRLLGYPRGWVMRDRARELADWARAWYAQHGHPWVYARRADSLDITNGSITISGVAFTSARLLTTLREAGAHGVIVVAASAGQELELEARRLWQEGRPDEYFFLEVYGSAVVEHLVTMTGARLCAWADSHQMAVLPHYSPGYPDWDINEQPRLLELIAGPRGEALPAPLEVLESGMLRPKKSLLAVFGVTRHVERVQRLTGLAPCTNCSFLPCQYRRAPYLKAPESSNPELAAYAGTVTEEAANSTAPLDRHAKYTVNAKALRRWANERLSLDRQPDGSVDATFRYEGTTCTNMGRPLEFHYQVTLGPRHEGYPIRRQHCSPAPGDTGHTYMCRYVTNQDQLLVAIDDERPLQGRSLNDVIAWTRPAASAGCYCEPESREHKWGLVLETIHYALAQEEANP